MSYETQRERDEREYRLLHTPDGYGLWGPNEDTLKKFDSFAKGKIFNVHRAVENEFLKKELDKASRGCSEYPNHEIEKMKEDFERNKEWIASTKKDAVEECEELRNSEFFMELIKDIYGDKVSFDKSIDKETNKTKGKSSVESDVVVDDDSKDESVKENEGVLLKNISGKGLKLVTPKQGEPYYRVGLSVTPDVSENGYATIFCKKEELQKQGDKDMYTIDFGSDSSRNVHVTKNEKDAVVKMTVSELSVSHDTALASKNKSVNRSKVVDAELGDVKASSVDVQKDDI